MDISNSKSVQLLVLSATTPDALKQQSMQLAQYLEKKPEWSLADIAWTLQVCRREHRYRAMIITNAVKNTINALKNIDKDSIVKRDADNILSRTNTFHFSNKMAENVLASYCNAVPSLCDDIKCYLKLTQVKSERVKTFIEEYVVAIFMMRCGIKPNLVMGDGVGAFTAAAIAKALPLIQIVNLLELSEFDKDLYDKKLEKIKFNPNSVQLFSIPQNLLFGVGDSIDETYFANVFNPKRAKQYPKETGSCIIKIGELSGDTKESDSSILELIGKKWLAGIRIDWTLLHKDSKRYRIPLPTYPFQRKRYVTDEVSTPNALASVVVETRGNNA